MEELQDCQENHGMPSSGHNIAITIMNSQQLNKIYTRFAQLKSWYTWGRQSSHRLHVEELLAVDSC